MPFEVLLSEQAERASRTSTAPSPSTTTSKRPIESSPRWRKPAAPLPNFPERGNAPKELQPLGIAEFRGVHYKPYRVIYRIFGTRVVVYCVLDGRRDMQSLLQRRLTR